MNFVRPPFAQADRNYSEVKAPVVRRVCAPRQVFWVDEAREGSNIDENTVREIWSERDNLGRNRNQTCTRRSHLLAE